MVFIFYLSVFPTISHFIPNTSSSSAVITATGKASYTGYYMQDFTKSMCQSQASSSAITVRDRRDNQDYTVRYINGNCWMTRNLAIGCNGSGSTYGSGRTTRSLTSTYSNVSTTWSTGSALSLDKNDNTTGCTTSSTSGCNSYDTARMKCSSSYGAWYNYAAATAGTITGSSNSTNATYDVCPKGWRLPTGSTDRNSEFGGIVSYASSFNIVLSGHYNSGNFSNEYGLQLYSATSEGDISRYNVNARNTSNLGLSSTNRWNGQSIRCIRSS